jgi:predicted  nucleic acid-binding Zn ribbon protein
MLNMIHFESIQLRSFAENLVLGFLYLLKKEKDMLAQKSIHSTEYAINGCIPELCSRNQFMGHKISLFIVFQDIRVQKMLEDKEERIFFQS